MGDLLARFGAFMTMLNNWVAGGAPGETGPNRPWVGGEGTPPTANVPSTMPGGTQYELRFMFTILEALRNIVTPILAIIAIGGIFLAIYIGFRLASAEEEGKRKEAKKQLLWAVIAVVGVGLLAFFFGFLPQIIGIFI